MAIKPSDIVYVYSGGSTNQDPNESLGGDPSAFSIPGGVNNLFDNVSNEESLSGGQDHRCFYIFNDSAGDSLFSPTLFIESQTPLGASCVIGITDANDEQRITIESTTGGSLDMSFDGEAFTWDYDVDLAVWGINLQTELNTLSSLSEVAVTTSIVDGLNQFDIAFEGVDGSRNQDLILLTTNSLVGSPEVVISKQTEGGPINLVTTEIAVDTVPPSNVAFQVTDLLNPITLQTIRPADGIAVWIQRTSPPGSQPIEGDGLIVRLLGSAF